MGDRQPRRPTAVPLAEARIAIPFGAAFDGLVPQHRQSDVLALELAVHLSQIGLAVTPDGLAWCRRQQTGPSPARCRSSPPAMARSTRQSPVASMSTGP